MPTDDQKRLRSRLLQGLLLVAVAVAAGWLVMDPSPEPIITAVTALVALLSFRFTTSEPVPRKGPLPRDRVAVLPLRNITAGTGHEYFADGLTEELISVLSRIRGLRVIARTSVMQYKDAARSLARIGRELNAGIIMEGSVRLVGQDLRVSVHLVEASSENHLWSADYDRQLDEIFAVQTDIALQVADALQVRLFGDDAERIREAPTHDLEAYDLYLLGRHDLNRRTEEGIRRSIERFRAAVDKDPGFAAAWAGLADAHVLATIGYATIPSLESCPIARAAAERALEEQDTLADAHTSLGWVFLNHDWDWPAAERHFQRALELNPSDARAYQWYAQFLSYQGRFLDAIPMAQKARDLDPRSPLIVTESGWPFSYLGRHEEALERFEDAIRLDPDFALAHYCIGWTREVLGDFVGAVEKHRLAVRLSERAPMMVAFLARALARKGEIDEARQLLDELIAAADSGAGVAIYVALVYERLGETEAALEWLQRSAAGREPMVIAIGSTWMPFDSLKSDERFHSIIESLPTMMSRRQDSGNLESRTGDAS